MTIKVQVDFDDNSSLTHEELIKNLQSQLGDNIKVNLQPVNNTPDAHLYFAIQQMITEKQAELWFDDGPHLYESKIKDLRKDILKQITFVLNRVIIDNEDRMS